MKRIALLSFLPLVLLSCTKKIETTRPAPRYPAYTLLAVSPPTVDADVLRKVADEDKAEFQKMIDRMTAVYLEDVTANVSSKSKLVPHILTEGTITDASALILKSTFKKIRPGNQATRFVMSYLVGLPIAGKPLIEMEFKLLDGKTGMVIESEEEHRDTAFRMGSFEDDLSIMYTKELAGEAAGFVVNYMQTDLNEE